MASCRMPTTKPISLLHNPHRITMIAYQNRQFIRGGEPSSNTKTLCAVFGFICVVFTFVSVANSQTFGEYGSESQVVGFTEPYKQIELSSDELGSIAEMFVAEGDFVTANSPIAQLDARIQELHAGDAEIIRAEMEHSIAESNVLSAKEDAAVRKIEMQRAAMQLERRSILAPFDGVVSKIHRHRGEYLSPLKPEVVTIVQIHRLVATFNVPSSKVSMFEVGTTFQVELASGKTVDAVVEKIGVVTDAQSGTVEIKLVIENADGNIRSGESVALNI